MNILVDSGAYGTGNLGDLAMLTGLLDRLRRLRPGSRITVISLVPSPANIDTPYDVVPPICLARSEEGSTAYGLRFLEESLERHLLATPAARWRKSSALGREFARADLVVAAGGGYMNDTFWLHAQSVLTLLRSASLSGKAVAMVSQGFGPLSNRLLIAHLRRTLPRVGYVGLRESIQGPRLLESLGFRGAVVTGDDALWLVKSASGGDPVGPIGLNLRVAHYSGVRADDLSAFRSLLAELTSALETRIRPLPVQLDAGGDRQAIERLTRGLPAEADTITSPANLVEAIGTCRLVVTGSYHAALFAASQAVPTVCIEASPYYVTKFQGIQDRYPGVLTICRLSEPDLAGRATRLIKECSDRRAELRSSTEARRAAMVGDADAGLTRYLAASGW